MRAVVGGLVEGLDSEQRRRVVFPFDADLHKRWTYLPGQRPGLRLGDLSDEQLEPALDLLQPRSFARRQRGGRAGPAPCKGITVASCGAAVR